MRSSWSLQQGDSRPPPATANLAEPGHVFVKRRGFMCDCSRSLHKTSLRERWISGVKAPFQCEHFPPVIILENLGLALLREKKGLLKNEIDECLKTWKIVKGYFISHPGLDMRYSKLSLFQVNENNSNYLSMHGEFIGSLRQKSKGILASAMAESRCSIFHEAASLRLDSAFLYAGSTLWQDNPV